MRRFLIPTGAALLVAALAFLGAVPLGSRHAAAQMPTPDRLAEPTLPPNPTQADRGAQLYWLHCMPCHGDRGQGLTDEFRRTYPPEDQNCWSGGCHGKTPYEDGFTLPTAVPGLIGGNSLQKFATAASLQAFIAAAMPFWNPASLSDEEYWSITAFLLRSNGLWDGHTELTPGLAADVGVGPEPAPTSELDSGHAAPTTVAAHPADASPKSVPWWATGGLLLALLAAYAAWRLIRHRQRLNRR